MKCTQLSSNYPSIGEGRLKGCSLFWEGMWRGVGGRQRMSKYCVCSGQGRKINIPFQFVSCSWDAHYNRISTQSKHRPKMSTEPNPNPQESLAPSHNESIEKPRLKVTNKKRNYSGLQGASRKKSKLKHWKLHQNKKYVDFLRENMTLFEQNRQGKRLMKINILMSNHVKSKNSTQCRSHHQKMLAHYKTIQNIIASLALDDYGEKAASNRQEPVAVEPEEDVSEDSEEIEKLCPPRVYTGRDVFEVMDFDCWGYMDFPAMEDLGIQN